MEKLPLIDVSIPNIIDVGRPKDLGPSVFPNSVDQLKLINYSAVPAGGQIEKDLQQYYLYMSKVASNTASESDLVSLKQLMVRVREYIVTEDDFNLMADSVRTTQEYLLNALQAENRNFSVISEVAQSLADNLNAWSTVLQEELAKLAAEGGTTGAPVIYSKMNPGNSALGYLWIDREMEENYIAPPLSYDPDRPVEVVTEFVGY